MSESGYLHNSSGSYVLKTDPGQVRSLLLFPPAFSGLTGGHRWSLHALGLWGGEPKPSLCAFHRKRLMQKGLLLPSSQPGSGMNKNQHQFTACKEKGQEARGGEACSLSSEKV